MTIYVFGNKDDKKDKVAFEVADSLKKIIQDIEFRGIKPNEDLPFENEEDIILMDGIMGLNEVALIENTDKFDLGPKNSVHDFDLAFQLKYLKKIGKIGKVKIIGLPIEGKVKIEEIIEVIKGI